MAIYAIGDLHLSFSTDKPMDVFGDNWLDYENKIKKNWLDKIKEEDCVLIPGDISWALNLDNASEDLNWINSLPGKKIFVRGNHDYWWSSLKKMNDKYPDMEFIQNNYTTFDDYCICGTRGWIFPNEVKFSDEDEKIYKRELLRLRMSLDSALKSGCEKIIAMIHFPPIFDGETSGFSDIFEEYSVEKVIYGHLHTEESFKDGFVGIKNGVEYILASSDYLDFDPIIIR